MVATGPVRTEAGGALLWIGAAVAAGIAVSWMAFLGFAVWAEGDWAAVGGEVWHVAIIGAGLTTSAACVSGYRRWRGAHPLPPVLPRGPAFWLLVTGTAAHAVAGALLLPFAVWPAFVVLGVLNGTEAGSVRDLAVALLLYGAVVTVAVGFPALSALAAMRARRQPAAAAGLAFACVPLLPWGLLHLTAALLLRQEPPANA